MNPEYAPDFFNQPGGPDLFFRMFGPMIGLLALFVIIELILKGISLWRAARMEKTGWFVALFILNTAGILPLIFLLITNQEYDRLQRKPKPARRKK